eukprot:scaffold2807_cov336-Prasinococcus_capsulatus_cf.AAC.5
MPVYVIGRIVGAGVTVVAACAPRFYDGYPHSYAVPENYWRSAEYLQPGNHPTPLDSRLAVQDRVYTDNGLNLVRPNHHAQTLMQFEILRGVLHGAWHADGPRASGGPRRRCECECSTTERHGRSRWHCWACWNCRKCTSAACSTLPALPAART